MADTLSLLFELDTDPSRAIANFKRLRAEFAREIAAVRKTLTQPFQLPPVRPLAGASAGARGQADAHVKEFRRIEAEAARSAKTQERAVVASLRAQERAAAQASRRIVSSFRDIGRGIGPGLQSIGRTLTIGVTAPLLALGAASLKSAKDLDANVNTLKAFIGSAEAAEVRLAQLIKTARGTPGLTTNLALTLDSFLRTSQVTEEAIDRVLPAIGRLNAVSRLQDPARFTENLVQLITQNFERPDLKELVGQSPIAGQLITEIFNVDSPINSKAIKAAAQKMGIDTVEELFTAIAQAAERNQGLANVTESIGTRFDKIVDRVTVALRPLGLAILNVIEPFIEPLAKLIERIGAAFDALSVPVKTAVIVIAGIAAAAGPVLFILGGLATAISSVIIAISTIGAAVVAVGLPGIAAAIAGLVIIIGEWAAILAVLGLAWKNNFLNIRGLVTDAAIAVSDAFTRIRTVVEEVTQRILPTLQSITSTVLATVTALWERYGATVIRVISTSFEVAVRILESFIRFFGNVVDLVLKLIDGDWRGAWRAFSRIIINALDSISEFFSKALPLISRGFLTLHAFIIRQAAIFVLSARKLASQFILALVAGFIAGAPFVSDALAKMLLLAAAGVVTGPIGAALVARLLDSMRKAAAEGVTVPVVTEEQGLARIRLNPDGSLKTERPKPRPPSPDGAGKGADAETRRRIRLLELEAEEAEAISRQKVNAENILFEQRKTSLKAFTDFQIKEEEIVLEKKKAVFAAERAEAEKLGKGRELALGEIRLKELKAEIDFTDRRNQLLANQQREELEATKAHRQALLDIQDDGDQRQLELIDSYVERYLISYEEAEKRRIKLEDDARARRRAELETQLIEAGDNIEEQQRVSDALNKLKAESATATEEAENRKRRALQATTEAEEEYYETLFRVTQQARALLRDAADIGLRGLVRRFGDRRKFRLESLRLEREANEDQHAERLRQIEQEKRDAEKRLEGVRDAEEKLLALRAYYAGLEKAEIERRAAERRDEDEREASERDPFSALRRRLEGFRFEIENTNEAIKDSLASLSEQVDFSIGTMVDAFRQAIVANILYGESIGKALKAALAQQLAAISAEAAIQSLKHAAYALGSLAFGDFAGAAKHAAAAAAFGGLALAAGLAGRALSKSAGLFERNRTSGTASTAVSGEEPRNREFQNGSQGVESSSSAVREGSGGILGRLIAFQQQSLDIQRQQQLQNAQLTETLTRLKTARAGDVVTMGAADAREAIGVAVIDHSNASGEFNERLQRNLGFT
jgi:hypothetical protein